MVGDDGRNVHGLLAPPPAIEQVGQAVVEFGDEDHHLARLAAVPQLPVRLQFIAQRGQKRPQRGHIHLAGGTAEHHAHEEAVFQRVVELLRRHDVAPRLIDERGDLHHNAGLVGTGEG